MTFFQHFPPPLAFCCWRGCVRACVSVSVFVCVRVSECECVSVSKKNRTWSQATSWKNNEQEKTINQDKSRRCLQQMITRYRWERNNAVMIKALLAAVKIRTRQQSGQEKVLSAKNQDKVTSYGGKWMNQATLSNHVHSLDHDSVLMSRCEWWWFNHLYIRRELAHKNSINQDKINNQDKGSRRCLQ